MAHRYFTQEIEGDTAFLAGDEAAHLARVLRAKPGQRVLLCDGAGTDYDAEVLEADPQQVRLHVLARRPCAAEPSVEAWVFFGYAKGERTEQAIQKSVELGAAALWPFFSANTVVKPKNEEEKNRRYQRVAAEAAKQSGRGILPPVGLPLDFEAMLEKAAECDLMLFFYEGGGVALRRALYHAGPVKRVAIITGAEGGFTPEEAEAARRADCVTTGLGPRILRCETAPAAALAALMALTGNLE